MLYLPIFILTAGDTIHCAMNDTWYLSVWHQNDDAAHIPIHATMCQYNA